MNAHEQARGQGRKRMTEKKGEMKVERNEEQERQQESEKTGGREELAESGQGAYESILCATTHHGM